MLNMLARISVFWLLCQSIVLLDALVNFNIETFVYIYYVDFDLDRTKICLCRRRQYRRVC